VGILEDVPIKVGDLYMPVDFVIHKMEEDTRTPIILRRPLLPTTGCRIDVKNGKLSSNVVMIMWSSTCLRLLNFLPFLMNVI